MKITRILFVLALILSTGMQAEAKKVKLFYQLKVSTWPMALQSKPHGHCLVVRNHRAGKVERT